MKARDNHGKFATVPVAGATPEAYELFLKLEITAKSVRTAKTAKQRAQSILYTAEDAVMLAEDNYGDALRALESELRSPAIDSLPR